MIFCDISVIIVSVSLKKNFYDIYVCLFFAGYQMIKTENGIEIIGNEELSVYESSDDMFKKSNLFIESKYKASLFEHKLLDIILSRIQQRKYVTFDDDGSILCSIPAGELKELLGVKSGNFYTKLKPMAASLTDTMIGYEDDANKEFMYLTLFSYAKYADAVFSVKINKDLRPYINPDTKFTFLQLPVILKFRSKYTLKLYEVLSSYCYPKKRPGMIKHMPKTTDGKHYKIEIGLSELKFTLGVIDSSSRAVKKILKGQPNPDYDKAMQASLDKSFNDWSDFKKRVIDVAVKEINSTSECGMQVKYEKLKSGIGGKVHGVIFYVELVGNNKPSKEEEKNTKQQAHTLSEDEMFEVQFSVKSLIKENVTLKDIKALCNAAEYDFEKIKQAYEVAGTAGDIKNLVGFMLKAIKDDYQTPVKKTKSKKKNSFNNFEQRQYDFDDFERQLLNKEEQ